MLAINALTAADSVIVPGMIYKVVSSKVDTEGKDYIIWLRVMNDKGEIEGYRSTCFALAEEELKSTPKEDVKITEKKGEVKMAEPKNTLRAFLQSQGVSNTLIDGFAEWRKEHGVNSEMVDRIPVIKSLYIGGEVWSLCIAAILSGMNILLEGAKATGKNVLAENLAFAFGRPMWDASFHINMDASSLVGADTFKNNEVQFRPGVLHEVGKNGGFGVLDEINMARSEAVAVLHQALDDRRYLDVPGYGRLKFDSATRFIATMNYGYSGTRELNEALVSRFVVIHVDPMSKGDLLKYFQAKFPNARKDALEQFVGVFNDLQTKAMNAEISTKTVDLRGIINSIQMVSMGVKPITAITSGIINKAFDQFERSIVADTVKTRIREAWTSINVFKDVPLGSGLDVDFSSVKGR
jgi:MoxR-like ATPase